MTTSPACPVCGSPTRRAFPKSPNYVTCTRAGHVSNTDPS